MMEFVTSVYRRPDGSKCGPACVVAYYSLNGFQPSNSYREWWI